MISEDTAGPSPQLPGLQAGDPEHHGLSVDKDQERSGPPTRETTADSVAAGPRIDDADPNATSVAGQVAGDSGERELVAAAAPAEGAPVKPARRTRRPKADKANEHGQDSPPKAPRRSRQAAGKDTATAISAAPVQAASLARLEALGEPPPITERAIEFLDKSTSSPRDLFELDAASKKFVEYHIGFEQIMKESQDEGWQRLSDMTANLKTQKRPVHDSQPVTDAASAQVKVPRPSTDAGSQLATVLPGAYKPRPLPISTPVPVKVRMGKIESVPDRPAEPPKEMPDPARDTRHAYNVIATALLLTRHPRVEVARDVAADMVGGDLVELHAIKDGFNRNRALNAIRESSNAQPHYRAELEKQDPELVRTLDAAHEARQALFLDETADVENTIEPSREQVKQEQPAASAPPAEKRDRGIKPGKDLLAGIVGVAQAAGAWLASRAKPRASPGVESPAKATAPVSPDKPAPDPVDRSTIVPDSVARRFLRDKDDYYFPDRTPAFSDRGTKLATRGAHPEVVRSLIEIAQARGWDSITVKGAEDFKRSAWMQAAQAGLNVIGYKPTALDLSELASKPANNTVEQSVVRERTAAATVVPERGNASIEQPVAVSAKGDARPKDMPAKDANADAVKWTDLTRAEAPAGHATAEATAKQGAVSEAGHVKKGGVTGRLVDHGEARYRHNPDEKMNYFVTLETTTGPETRWGVNLKQAVSDGKFQKGEIVTVERVGKEPVTVEANVRDDAGEVVGTKEIVAERVQWKLSRVDAVEKDPAARTEAKAPDPELVKMARAFEENKPAFVVRKHPELAGAYGLLDAAKKFAEERLPEAARDGFVGLARNHLIRQITLGQPIEGPMIYADAIKSKDAGKDKAAEVVDLGKPAREKAVARDR